MFLVINVFVSNHICLKSQTFLHKILPSENVSDYNLQMFFTIKCFQNKIKSVGNYIPTLHVSKQYNFQPKISLNRMLPTEKPSFWREMCWTRNICDKKIILVKKCSFYSRNYFRRTEGMRLWTELIKVLFIFSFLSLMSYLPPINKRDR